MTKHSATKTAIRAYAAQHGIPYAEARTQLAAEAQKVVSELADQERPVVPSIEQNHRLHLDEAYDLTPGREALEKLLRLGLYAAPRTYVDIEEFGAVDTVSALDVLHEYAEDQEESPDWDGAEPVVGAPRTGKTRMMLNPSPVGDRAFALIQRASRPDLSRPYPFQIDAEGTVLAQETWQGDPLALVGFRHDADPGPLDLHLSDFLADPQAAVGMWCVMVNADGGMYVWDTEVSHVEAVAG